MKWCSKYCVVRFCPEFKLVLRLTNESLTTPTELLSQEICILPLKHAFKYAVWKGLGNIRIPPKKPKKKASLVIIYWS